VARGSIRFNNEDKTRVPDSLNEAAGLLMDLKQRGILDAVAERVRIRRQGGYCGLDVVIMLLLFLAAAPKEGLRLFWEKQSAHLLRLGALAGRRRLPSPASVSRALANVEVERLREGGVAGWLLAGAPQIDEMLRHPVMKTYDTKGAGWQVFHLDPTVETLRHRALPDDESLPDPQRRSEETGAPGYPGRKRGDLQFRRSAVQHAGSSAWIHAHLSPGNGDVLADFKIGLDSIVSTCARIEHPLEHTMVVMDGEYGNVPAYDACRQRNLPFVTRLNRPNLYIDTAVLERLYQATWHRVPLSGCAPHRAAADLGIITIAAGKRTRRDDGDEYEPITVRVVASIFPKEGKAKRGVTLDGWQVELFAVDLPPTRSLRLTSSPYTSAALRSRTASCRTTASSASIGSSATTCRDKSSPRSSDSRCGTCVSCAASRSTRRPPRYRASSDASPSSTIVFLQCGRAILWCAQLSPGSIGRRSSRSMRSGPSTSSPGNSAARMGAP
jgi:hypothetical protein